MEKILSYIKNNKRLVTQHVLLWIGIITLLAFPYGIRASFVLVLPLILPVYLHFFFLDKYHKRKQYISYGFLTILTIVVFGVIADYMATRPMMMKEITVIDEIELFRTSYYNMLIIAAQYNPFIGIVISTVIRYFREKQQFSLQELQEQKTRAELDLLKSQVNPHFLFNTLNTLFSMSSMKDDKETAEGISKLSELMRYMIYETKVEKISLGKEIEYIRNFIELQKLRFSEDDDLDVTFLISGDSVAKVVPPMLFIPFIENAFKFGFSISQKSVIEIRLNVEEQDLTFSVKNTINKKKTKSNEHSGVGISNVKKRLDLLYPNSYKLEITQDEEYFNVNLNFPV